MVDDSTKTTVGRAQFVLVGCQWGLLSVVISELCLDSCLRCKVSQTVWQKAGLLVADVVSFERVHGLLMGSECVILVRSRELVEVCFSISAILIGEVYLL